MPYPQMHKKKVSIILCCYNEEEGISLMIDALEKVMASVDYDYEIIAVDDGSSDQTLQRIKDLTTTHPNLYFIEFSRNFGHQNALKAGLDFSRGDCLISLDADMQHPPELLPEMLKKWEEGYDVVYTSRMEDKDLSAMKRKTSKMFYKLLNALSDIELEQGAADFRLLDRKAANMIISLKENDLFMRGLVKWIGFKQYGIDYMPNKRVAGASKYTLKKMFRFALQGITSFSVRPLYIALYLGFFVAACSILYIPYIIYSLIYGHPISGWASLIATIAFLGGLQLCILGIIGIYIGKLFMQSKYRPNYIVRSSNIQ